MKIYGISDMWYDPTTLKVVILTQRPGVFIGIRGSNFNAVDEDFKKFAKENGIAYDGIKLIEDTDPFENSLYYPIYSDALLRRFQ